MSWLPKCCSAILTISISVFVARSLDAIFDDTHDEEMFISLVLKEMQSLIMLSACTLVHRKVDARVSSIISFIVVPFYLCCQF